MPRNDAGLSPDEQAAIAALRQHLTTWAGLHQGAQRRYYQTLGRRARPVRLVSWQALPEPGRGRVARLLAGWQPAIKQCYSNAALVSLALNGMDYCEGLAPSLIPVEHAWNCYRGWHFDLTAEVALADPDRSAARDLFGRLALGYARARAQTLIPWQRALEQRPWLTYAQFRYGPR